MARAKHPKPRNLVGIAKDLTVPEMEAPLMANQPATEAMAAELAAQRGQRRSRAIWPRKAARRAPLPGRPKTGSQVPRVHPRQS